MKRIGILTCLNATGICSGAACFKALNTRQGAFSIYSREEVEVLAFFHCNGCSYNYEKPGEYDEKIQRVIDMKPDAVHIGKCTITQDQECCIITNIAETISKEGIEIIRGTH